jgi:hypothetical protein
MLALGNTPFSTIGTYSHEHGSNDEAITQIVPASFLCRQDQESNHEKDQAYKTGHVQGFCHTVPCVELWDDISRYLQFTS